MDSIIKTENLGKAYMIGHQSEGKQYLALRDVISDKAKEMWSRIRNPQYYTHQNVEEFWALKNINLEIKEGERLGIIGRNGAGKTTLLKVLSRITEPNAGRAVIRGRVASLLEVGTGFHPELTGRENIFLNGSILGMNRQEIKSKFDEIVDFAEVENFLDTPVKRYSSGMFVRLAFAVAAHIEPEILVVDEVLAVGDAEFQKKALGKMESVSKEGRTVLFVSHNMSTISSLCSRSILLENGRLKYEGNTSDVIKTYFFSNGNTPHHVDYSIAKKNIGDKYAALLEGSIKDLNDNKIGEIHIQTKFKICMKFKVKDESLGCPIPNFHLFDENGQYVFVTSNSEKEKNDSGVGMYKAECIIPGNLLNNGIFYVGLALTFIKGEIHVSYFEKHALTFSIIEPNDELYYKNRNGFTGAIPGKIRPSLEWRITREK